MARRPRRNAFYSLYEVSSLDALLNTPVERPILRCTEMRRLVSILLQFLHFYSCLIRPHSLHAVHKMWLIPSDVVRRPTVLLSRVIVNIWNSLPDYVVEADSLNAFKNRLDKYWTNHARCCLWLQIRSKRNRRSTCLCLMLCHVTCG